MRRLWAYIIIAFTAIVAMGASFPAIFEKVNTNIEYQNGKELVFRISDKEDEEFDLPEDGSAAKNIADVMSTRLSEFGITNYTVATEGIDTVKVAFSGSEDQYAKAEVLLSFNGSLALTTSGTDNVLGEEFLTDEKAYLDDVNGYPSVVIPVDTENEYFNKVIEAVKDQQAELDQAQDTSESEEAASAYLYLWYDYILDVDNFADTQETLEDGKENPTYDANMAKKIIMSFAANNLWYPDEQENKLAATLNVDTDGDGFASELEIRNAYAEARYYVQLINAGEIDYNVDFMYSRKVAATVETLIDSNVDLAWSRTLIAFLCAIVIVSLLLVVFYRLGSVSVITSTLVSLFAGIASIILFKVQFNTAAIIGLAILAVASLVSGVIYLTKLKEESYKGRSLKKANTEASKKSLLPIVDVNVVIIVIGAMAYLLGGNVMRSFSAALVLGGIVSLIANTLLLKGMMWLATNATSLTGKYNLFGVENDKVPNIVNEEKQTYYGPFADRNFNTKKKVSVVSILTLLLSVASIAGSIVFGVINNGEIYNTGAVAQNSQIYVETTTKNSDVTLPFIETYLENIYVHTENTEEGRENAAKLTTYVDTYYEADPLVETLSNGVEVTNYYYIVTLNTNLSTNVYAFYNDTDSLAGATQSYLINDLFTNVFNNNTTIDSKATMNLKEVNVTSQQLPGLVKDVSIATLVAIAILTVYFLLRYKLTRGLATMLVTIATGAITFGVFVLTRIAVPAYVTIAVPFVVAFTLIISILFMNRERELILEDKSRDTSIEHRNELMVKANALAFSPIVISLVLAIYLAINFYGFGPLTTSSVFALAAIGCLVATLVVTTVLGPCGQMLMKWFRGININVKPRKPRKGKKQVTRKKSAEPEEAIFIGIND